MAHVASGLVLDHAPPAVYRSLLSAPRAVLWKAALFAGVVRRQDVAWSRTARDEVERTS